MAPKNTRKGGVKVSKGGDKHESMAIVKAEAEAEADAETETGTHLKVDAGYGRKYKKHRRTTNDASKGVARDCAGRKIGRGGGASLAALAVGTATYKSVISSMVRANRSNGITEENFYLLHWLYRIRRVGCARGLLIGFLQPDFLWSIYRPMMRSKKLWRTDLDINIAVDLWCSNRTEAEKRYGHISDWDVSSVTNMRELFYYKREFNDDISRWDVSKVTNMSGMFSHAELFNQPVGDWNLSKVTDMSHMFWGARSFNQPVGNWDVSKVTGTSCMFWNAHLFNQPVGDWDVSNVTNMGSMFDGAQSFNQPVGDWNLSKVTKMACMFHEALVFNQAVGDWDVSKVTDMSNMFLNAHAFNQDLTRWDIRSVTFTFGMFECAHDMQRDNMPAAVKDD